MAKFVPQEEMSLLDQVQVRHDKLAALRAEGRDPFEYPHMACCLQGRYHRNLCDYVKGILEHP